MHLHLPRGASMIVGVVIVLVLVVVFAALCATDESW